MSVKISVSLHQAAYLPGDIVWATVKIWNDASSADGSSGVLVSEMVVDSQGLERVDPHWVAKLYHAEVPMAHKEGRRIVRHIYTCEPARLLSDTFLGEGAAQQFVVRFRLPWRMPPSFKGSSVRFSYSITAVAKYSASKDSLQPGLSRQTSASNVDSLMAGTSNNSTGGLRALLPRTASLSSVNSIPLEKTATTTSSFVVLPMVRPEEKRLRERSITTHTTPTGDDGDVNVIEYELNHNLKVKWEVLPDTCPTPTLSSLSGRLPLPSSHPGPGSQIWDGADEASSVVSRSIMDSDDDEPETSTGAKIASPTGHTPRSPIVGPRGNSGSRTYNLRMGDGQLVKFMLQPPLEGPLQPGRTFGGVLDFRVPGADDPTATTPKCLQVCILLETEEGIPSDYMHNTRSAAQNLPIRKLYSEHQEAVLDSVLTHFMFTIPTSAPPSFRTHMVTLRWVLRFELTTGIVRPGNASERTIKPLTDVLVWTLPVVVQPSIHA